MRTSNPALSEDVFRIQAAPASDVMTIEGTSGKTMLLLGVVVLVAGIVWKMVYPGAGAAIPQNAWGFVGIGSIGGLIVAMVTIFKPNLAPVTSPIYAAFEGLFLGAFSAIFEVMYPGIVTAAIAGTFGVMGTMLVAYRFRIIRATEKFRMGVVAATGGIALVFLVSILMSMFGGGGLAIVTSNSWLGIGFSLFVVVIAALNLVLDFDFIEMGAAHGAPKYMEWYGAFGLLVTLIWLYIAILRLLAKLQSRD